LVKVVVEIPPFEKLEKNKTEVERFPSNPS
jgi:hypothetical protein